VGGECLFEGFFFSMTMTGESVELETYAGGAEVLAGFGADSVIYGVPQGSCLGGEIDQDSQPLAGGKHSRGKIGPIGECFRHLEHSGLRDGANTLAVVQGTIYRANRDIEGLGDVLWSYNFHHELDPDVVGDMVLEWQDDERTERQMCVLRLKFKRWVSA
jgi:hypothetical protein